MITKPVRVAVVALTCLSCTRSALDHGDATGCYELNWGPESLEQAHLFPDGIRLTTDLYRNDCCDGRDTMMVNFDARVAQPLSTVPDTAFVWQNLYAGNMYWYLVADSVRLSLGHDCAECIGFTASLHGGRLSGTGYWITDYQEDRFPALEGQRVSCPVN